MRDVGIRPIVIALLVIAVALASEGASHAGGWAAPESKLDTQLRMILAETQEPESARTRAGRSAFSRHIAMYSGDQLVKPSDAAGIEADTVEPLRFGVLVRVTDDPERLADTGASVGGVVADVVSVRATLDEVLAIAALPNVTWVESSRRMDSTSAEEPPMPRYATVQPALNQVIPYVGVDLWHDQGITGEDVIVGVIDTGIWPEHPSFADDQGGSRIIGAWDQTNPAGPPPTGFTYGTSWTHSDFNNGTADITDQVGHGTAVTSALAGSEVDGITGVAPGAQIRVYKTTGFTSDLVDAIDAAVMDGVDVINYSIGSHAGPHDGTSLVEEALAFLFNHAGVFVSTSAGNDGNRTVHASGPVNPGERTSFSFNMDADPAAQDRGPGYFNFYYDALEIDVCSGIITPNGFNIGPVCPNDSQFIDTQDGCGFVGNFGPNPANGKNEIIIDIIGPQQNCPNVAASGEWTLYFDGSPLGSSSGVEGWSVQGVEFLPPFGNTDSTVHVPGTANDVMTSGAFVTRTSYLAQDGQTYFADPEHVGALATFSSRGPTAADVIKPDITAPGVQILAANSPAAGLGPSHFMDGMPGDLFRVISGTSMSSPHTAGAAALIKDLHPSWTPQQIKSALMATAVQNPVTGPALNNLSGAGNLDLSTFPVNDNFQDALGPTGVELPFTDSINLSIASVEPNEPSSDCPFDNTSGTVWYQFQGTGSGDTIRADTIGTNFDTLIDVFLGDPFGDPTNVACGAGLGVDDVIVEWDDLSDSVYTIRLSGSQSGAGGSAASAGAGGDDLLHFRLAKGQARTWADNNCSGAVDPIDSLLTLRFDAGLTADAGDCPPLGQVIDVQGASPHPWGDVDCSGLITPVDALKLLRFDAGLSVTQAVDCPKMGSVIILLV